MNTEALNIEEFEVDVKEIDHNCEMNVDRSDDQLNVRIPRALTATEARPFVNTIVSVIESSSGLTSLDLDFACTEFIDSSGLGALVQVINAARMVDCDIFASGVNDTVKSLLQMTRLDSLLQIRLH